ncbi:MAG: hypothetical protein A2284_00980 [Deltaproteobacteria bacterium RIFOXYA12_FULL_61_11]|nr:MAG: hypothetical protein A2284_00980 [Deltaproteobacteria bacterium RIFOXYA12_FULL_61_11]
MKRMLLMGILAVFSCGWMVDQVEGLADKLSKEKKPQLEEQVAGDLQCPLESITEGLDECQFHSLDVVEKASLGLASLRDKIASLESLAGKLPEDKATKIREELATLKERLAEGEKNVHDLYESNLLRKATLQVLAHPDAHRFVLLTTNAEGAFDDPAGESTLKVFHRNAKGEKTPATVRSLSRLGSQKTPAGTAHLALVLDNSTSMTRCDLERLASASTTLLEALPTAVSPAILKFSDATHLTSPFGSDPSWLRLDTRMALSDRYATALWDGSIAGVDAVVEARTGDTLLGLVVVLSDGAENASSATREQLIARVREEKIPVLMVGLGLIDLGDMLDLVIASRGYLLYTPFSDDLSKVFGMVAELLSSLLVVETEEPGAGVESVVFSATLSDKLVEDTVEVR